MTIWIVNGPAPVDDACWRLCFMPRRVPCQRSNELAGNENKASSDSRFKSTESPSDSKNGSDAMVESADNVQVSMEVSTSEQ